MTGVQTCALPISVLVTAQPAVSCVHAIAEVASVFHRKLREGTVPQADFDFFCAQFEADSDADLWTWLPLPESFTPAAQKKVLKNIDDAPSA